jgi:hypothetical protein
MESTCVPLGQYSVQGAEGTSQYSVDYILPEIGTIRRARDRQKLVVPTDNAKPQVAK